MATGISHDWKNDAHSRKVPVSLKPRDSEILEEPYAQAVLVGMNCKPQEVLQAVKALQNRRATLTAEAVLREIMKPKSSPTPQRERLKRPAKHDNYSSDGESDEDSMENEQAKPKQSEDLQVDGEALKMPEPLSGIAGDDGSPRGPPAKKANLVEGVGRKESEDLRRKLLALREENRRLKTRQMCRKCKVSPVGITFLPCGHFSFCYECGQTFSSCPLCHKTILADVKTFLA